MIIPAYSAPCRMPPAGAGLVPSITEECPIRAAMLAPVSTEMPGEACPIRAVVLDRVITEYCPIRAVVRAVINTGFRVINLSNRHGGIGVPVKHESIEL